MKKFQFSLDHIREYKDRLLDEETGKLQRLRAQRDQIEQQIEELGRDFQAVSEEMQTSQRRGVTALELRGYSMQLENIRHQTAELKKQLEAAQARVDQQTQVVVAANQEVSKLDKLREHQLENWQNSARKAEEQRIEELVTQNHIRKTAG